VAIKKMSYDDTLFLTKVTASLLIAGPLASLYLLQRVRSEPIRQIDDGHTLIIDDLEFLHFKMVPTDSHNDFIRNSLDWSKSYINSDSLGFDKTYVPHRWNKYRVYWTEGRKHREDYAT
jgi:hypothetical protein